MNSPSAPFNFRILVAPLDWGLGHATRSIPIIRQLMGKGCEVILAGEGKVEALLRTEFPQLQFLSLQGYRIHYARHTLGLTGSLLQQIPQLLKAIRHEQQWLQQTVAQYNIDAVISDNRFGLYHTQIPSVFITHQLLIKTPFGKMGDAWLQKHNYRYLNRFSACWVPDFEGAQNLAGALSHPAQKPSVPLTYIGPLSRFEKREDTLQHYLLVLLSGPEPQRTLLEEKLLQQVQGLQQPVLFVRGLPGHVGLPKVPYHVNIVNHLPAATLQKAMEQAQYVISRTGYSTVMDVMALQKKSILIPTPGQAEQEYLARHLMKHNLALCLPQNKFVVSHALTLADNFPYALPAQENNNDLSNAVDFLLKRLHQQRDLKILKQ